MLKKIIDWWKCSRLLQLIIKIESKHFRSRLTNHGFTVLCSNCVGGVLYNKLGERFDSPTINISINNKQFCYFAANLDYYLSQQFERTYDTPDGVTAGLLKGNDTLPDIRVEFVHFATYESGVEKWEERKKRIHRDNLYLMMYDTDGVTLDDIKMLDDFKCNGKVIFTPNKSLCSKVDWAFYIKAENISTTIPNYYLLRNVFSLTLIDRKFDFVSFFNKK